MTHLTRTTQRGLFSTTVAERPNRETGADTGARPPMGSSIDQPFAIATDLTPDEARVTRVMGWAEPAARGSVVHTPPVYRGKHY